MSHIAERPPLVPRLVGAFTRASRVAPVGKLLWCGLAACGLFAVGCERTSPPSAASPPPMDPAVVLDTPQDAARTVCDFLRRHLHAVARHDQAAAAAARDQVVWHVAARDEILARQSRAGDVRPASDATILKACAESWAAVIAYYADGLELDQIKLGPAADAGTVAVQVPARGPDDQALIRVTCVRSEDDQWHVRTINFAKPPATVASVEPATRPTGDAAP